MGWNFFGIVMCIVMPYDYWVIDDRVMDYKIFEKKKFATVHNFQLFCIP